MWKRGEQRAPHKPLLVLLALARLQQNGDDALRYNEVAPKLKELLVEFGPSRKSYHPEYPFWRLQRDGVWQVRNAEKFTLGAGREDVPASELESRDAQAGFTPDIIQMFHQDPPLIRKVAREILYAHFPESIHSDIVAAVGLDVDEYEDQRRKKRDREFRGRILKAYDHSCAICGYDVRLGEHLVGLEAAHIMWHQAGGPDIETNGLALCALHHKALDMGAVTVLVTDYTLLVSDRVQGQSGVEEWLLRYHRTPIRPPAADEYRPQPEYLSWHRSEVFKEPSRD